MANEKNWIVNTWGGEDWQEAARFETYDEAVDWAIKTYGLHGDYTFENALETTMQAKRDAFGTGEVIYTTAEDFPARVKCNGRIWIKTPYEMEFGETGMVNYLYETYDTDDDVRLYIDAAGNIWDETELGIL